MDQPSLDRICVLKVNINCCEPCAIKIKKALLKINGVSSVALDREKRLASVTGKVDPKTLIKMLAKIGKKAELLSDEKQQPPIPKDGDSHVEGQDFKNMKNGHDKKNARARKKGTDREDCCCHDDFGHKIEEYVAPPKEFDDHICRDAYCKLHNRNMIIRNDVHPYVPPSYNATMIRPHPHSSRGYFHPIAGTSNCPGGWYREEVPPYGHYPPMMPPPAYGYHPRKPMPTLHNFAHYFSHENTKGCNIM